MRPFILIPFCFLLAACQTTGPTPVVVEYPRVAVPSAHPVHMREVIWKVYNADELEKLVEELKQNPDEEFVLIALTPKGYENLSTNIIELERYIKDQKEIIAFLKKTLDNRSEAVSTDTNE